MVDLPHILDVGCGPKKTAGAWGIDHHQYPGVDQIVDLDHGPWPLSADSFERIIASQVIEHVVSIPKFLEEIHRVGRNGALVEFTTPHYTNKESWCDPTHRWHLASAWHQTFTERGNYLTDQLPAFEFVSTKVSFRKNLLGRMGQLTVWLKGADWWEDHLAWTFLGHTVRTVLKIRKNKKAIVADG